MKLLSGNANLKLAAAIAKRLDASLTDATVQRFADSEVRVEIKGECPRRRCVRYSVDVLPGQ